MIVLDPLWELFDKQGINVYLLEYKYGLNPAEIHRLKHGHNYTLKSIDRYCKLFGCQPGEILLYRDDATVRCNFKEKEHN